MRNSFFVFFFLLFSFSGFGKALKLDINSLSRLALENNIDIQLARLRGAEAENNYQKSQSVFDTFIKGNFGYEKDKTLSNNQYYTPIRHSLKAEASLEKELPSGTKVDLDASMAREKNDSPAVSFSDARTLSAGVKLIQALGKNFFGLSARGAVKIAFLEKEIAALSTKNAVEKSLAAAQLSYWQLVLCRREEEIAKAFVKTAKDLLQIYERKFKVGLVEEPDVFAALANLKQRKIALLEAKARRQKAEKDLLYLLGSSGEKIKIIPQDKIETETKSLDFVPQLKLAFGNRRDYKIARQALKKENINLAIKKNALWPEIDLEASFSKNGLSDKYRRSLRQVSSDDFRDFSLGLKVSFSWEKRKEKAEYQNAKLKKARAILILKDIENLIFRQIYNQIISLNTAVAKVEAQRKILTWQKKKLEAEKKRLRYGRSSSDIIIRYENDLYQAELNLARALLSYRQESIRLKLRENTLLAELGGKKL